MISVAVRGVTRGTRMVLVPKRHCKERGACTEELVMTHGGWLSIYETCWTLWRKEFVAAGSRCLTGNQVQARRPPVYWEQHDGYTQTQDSNCHWNLSELSVFRTAVKAANSSAICDSCPWGGDSLINRVGSSLVIENKTSLETEETWWSSLKRAIHVLWGRKSWLLKHRSLQQIIGEIARLRLKI